MTAVKQVDNGHPDIQYNRSKIWQIAFFSLNNSATNIFLLCTNLISYYLVGYGAGRYHSHLNENVRRHHRSNYRCFNR